MEAESVPLKFTPIFYKCPHCNDTFASSRSGEWVACKCGKCYVDQTLYYIRVGGDAILVEENK